MSQVATAPHSELRALLHVIRQGWTEEERQRRRRVADNKQRWLLSVMAQADRRRAS